MITLSEFFLAVTGNEILPYQARFGSSPFTTTLLKAPTGLGKTETVLIPWLHAIATGTSAPRRLAFTLPRRNLTEQVADVVRKRLERAELKDKVDVLELMGGRSDNRET